MSLLKLSVPTKAQAVHGGERAVAVFVVSAAAALNLTHDSSSKAALVAAGLAGATAVWQLVLSTLTTL